MSTSTLPAPSRHAAPREEGHHPAMVETLTLHELSRLSREETSRYLRREPYSERFAFELFRRAIVERDEAAWATVYEHYTDIVRHWLGAPDEAAEEISATFARFWQAVDAAKFARFGSLSAVLQYLKMCAHTTRMDRMRSIRATAREGQLDDTAYEVPSDEDVEESAAARLHAADLWHTVQDVLPNERERIVVRLSFLAGLSPREICARYETEFPDVTEVYRLKRNALERLGRAAEIRAFR